MKEFCIQSQSALLYIRLTHTNVHVHRYRAETIGPGMEQLHLIGRWQKRPTLECNAKISDYELVELIRSHTGDKFNQVMAEVLNHQITREQGDSVSNPTPTTSPKTDGFISQKLKAASMSVSQLLRKPRQK